MAGQRKGGGGGKHARRQFPGRAASRERGDARGTGTDAPLSTRKSRIRCTSHSRQGLQELRCGGAGKTGTPLSEHVDVIIGGAKRWRFHREALLALLASAHTHKKVSNRRHLHRFRTSSDL